MPKFHRYPVMVPVPAVDVLVKVMGLPWQAVAGATNDAVGNALMTTGTVLVAVHPLEAVITKVIL